MKAAFASASASAARRLSWKPSTGSSSTNPNQGGAGASSSSAPGTGSSSAKDVKGDEDKTDDELEFDGDGESGENVEEDVAAAVAAVSVDGGDVAPKGLISDDVALLLNSKILKLDENASVIIEYDGESRGKWLATVISKATEEYRQSQSKALPPIIKRYIDCEKGDVAKGTIRWKNTLQWRIDNGVNYLLRVPHREFDIIKKYYPHYFHFKDLQGRPVYWEMIGKIDMAALKKTGLTLPNLLVHFITMSEYLWEYLCPYEEGKSVTILDLKGTTMKHFTGDVLSFIKMTNSVVGQHYPEKAGNIILINVPVVFSSVWRVIKGFIDPVTAKKVVFAKKSEVTKTLLKYIPEENIPVEYGGKCTVPFGASPEEKALASLMKELNTRKY